MLTHDKRILNPRGHKVAKLKQLQGKFELWKFKTVTKKENLSRFKHQKPNECEDNRRKVGMNQRRAMSKQIKEI